MNEKALRVLEYPKIIQKLTDYAGSQPGKELCRNLTPSSDLTQIRRMQRETSDAVSRLLRKGNVSFSGLADIRMSLRRLEVGSSLNVEELLRVAKLLETTLSRKGMVPQCTGIFGRAKRGLSGRNVHFLTAAHLT